MRSHPARHQPEAPADDGHLRRMRSATWHRQGIVVIRLEEITDDRLRRGVINLANEFYGRRGRPRGDEWNGQKGGESLLR